MKKNIHRNVHMAYKIGYAFYLLSTCDLQDKRFGDSMTSETVVRRLTVQWLSSDTNARQRDSSSVIQMA